MLHVRQHLRARFATHIFILSQFWTESLIMEDQKALQLSKLRFDCYKAKEEYAKRIGRIKERLQSGNPFVSRSGVSQGVVNDCTGTDGLTDGDLIN